MDSNTFLFELVKPKISHNRAGKAQVVSACVSIIRPVSMVRKDQNNCIKPVTSREKGGPTRARAHRHARTLPNPEALGPDIEEGAGN